MALPLVHMRQPLAESGFPLLHEADNEQALDKERYLLQLLFFFDISLIAHKCATSPARENATMLSTCIHYSLQCIFQIIWLLSTLSMRNLCVDAYKQNSFQLHWVDARGDFRH